MGGSSSGRTLALHAWNGSSNLPLSTKARASTLGRRPDRPPAREGVATKFHERNTMISIVSAVIGYVAGAFTPSIGRKLKALFVKESTAAKTAATTAVASVAGSAVAAVKTDIVSKL